jgi:hypothetical protein
MDFDLSRLSELRKYQLIIGLIIILLLLLIFYIPTLQTIVNGSSDLKMIDVGETQIVLNTWGTLHATGYPLYVITGNILVTVMKTFGVSAITAPALVSLFWGLIALFLLGVLLHHLTENLLASLLVVFIFGLTRFVWIHQVIAEIYSFGLVIQVLLLILAFWKKPIPHRIFWIAFVGGIGVAHHRGIGLVAPALIYAVSPEIWREIRQRWWIIILWLLVGLLGFLPYLYLPIRAESGAMWVYGQPNSWNGFWDQFNGVEAGYLVGIPKSYDAFLENFNQVNDLLLIELSSIGIVAGLIGLIAALFFLSYRRISTSFILSALIAYIFSTVFYFDILATLILAITLSLAFGWTFLIDILRRMSVRYPQQSLKYLTVILVSLGSASYANWLIAQNSNWIHDQTHDTSGLDTIAIVENTPDNSTLMLAWGPHHFAAGIAKDVLEQMPTIDLVDHNADFKTIAATSTLFTPDFTLFAQPQNWWESRIGQPVYLTAAAPRLIQIATEPRLFDERQILPEQQDDNIPVVALTYEIKCVGEFRALYVDWLALKTPTRDLSVLVHILNNEGMQLGNADQFAPVYGRRPLTTWHAREIVSDVYPLPEIEAAATVRFGLYEQLPSGEFQNYNIIDMSYECGK